LLSDLAFPHWLTHPVILLFGLISAAVLLEYHVTWRKAVHPIALLNLLHHRLGKLILAKPGRTNGVLALGSALMLLVPLLAVLWFIIHIAEFQHILIGVLLWMALGQWQLRHAAKRIYQYIAQDKKQLARDTLNGFVLRDTAQLSPLGIAKATTEMLILRHVYQQIVVIFWFAFTNIWVALSYRLIYELAAAWNPKSQQWRGIGQVTSTLTQLLQWPAVILYSVMVIVFNPNTNMLTQLISGKNMSPGTWLLTLYGWVIDAQLSGAYSYAGQRIRKPKLGTQHALKLDHIKRVLFLQPIWLCAYILLCSLIVWLLPETLV
jgi:adenosylcobinamide-phosphate synthase